MNILNFMIMEKSMQRDTVSTVSAKCKIVQSLYRNNNIVLCLLRQ